MIGAVLVLAVAGAAIMTRGIWAPVGAIAQGPRANSSGGRAVPVVVTTATRKPVPVRIDALGTVTPIASVAIKARVESQITAVHFSDGARVKESDLLFTLDDRAIKAQLDQADGVLARDRAQLEGAERDVRRFTDLIQKGATTQVSLDNAKTQVDVLRASIKADEAAVENLKVQLGYTQIRAPISGRISAASVKVGNFVRPADTSSLATINQIAPVYVTLSVPQRMLPNVRQAVNNGTARVQVNIPGDREPAVGNVAMIDNSVDVTTGMISLRATMDNADESLWPGTLVNAQVILRIEDMVTVPTAAVQVGQSGSYVFVVKNDAAMVRPVTVERTLETESIISKGLEDGEKVVVDGQLLLTNGTKVAIRENKAGT
jgi:RND family efflux transporter MFP subunit